MMEITLPTSEEDVREYLTHVVTGGPTERRSANGSGDRDTLPEKIFDLLTNRQFCHLSRGAAARYRARTLALLEASLAKGGPVPFWFDIGPGYHASLRPGERELSFDVGLSELLILHQIRSFCDRLAELHEPGGHFRLVVDNLCALRTNDIPVECTEGYCARFRSLVREQDLEDRVELLIESETFDLAEYDRFLDGVPREPLQGPVSDADVENVERFLGRRCDEAEALERIDRYRRTSTVTELLLERIVTGVRMTQRAGATTLGFRPFPGGDSRAQCGEVVLGRNAHGKLRPLLLTSRNVDDYDCRRLAFPDVLPSRIEHVTYAERL